MKDKLQGLAARFDVLSQRERLMVASVLFLLVGVMCYFPLGSLLLKHDQLTLKNKNIIVENTLLMQQTEAYKKGWLKILMMNMPLGFQR